MHTPLTCALIACLTLAVWTGPVTPAHAAGAGVATIDTTLSPQRSLGAGRARGDTLPR